MANLVFNGKDGQALTNSLLVAEKFGKEHRSVLSSIRELIKGGVQKIMQTPCLWKPPTRIRKTDRNIPCSS